MTLQINVGVVDQGVTVYLGGIVGVCVGDGDGELEGGSYVHAVAGGDVEGKVHDVVGVLEFYSAAWRWLHLSNVCGKEGRQSSGHEGISRKILLGLLIMYIPSCCSFAERSVNLLLFVFLHSTNEQPSSYNDKNDEEK